MKKAIFPGSFDPFTIGHKDIVDQALSVFDEVIIAVGKNSSKSCMFSLIDRIDFIKKSLGTNSKITIESYSDLTTTFCESKDVKFLIRGLRNINDFIFEKDIKDMQDTFDAQLYARNRLVGSATTSGYLPLQEQLDQLYRDMQSGKLGVGATTGEWYVGITSVKTAFPKPS